MTTTPSAPRLRMEFKVVPPKFDEADHPRDRKGRFIETGAEVRIWGGQLGKVLRNVGGGRIEVERADGQKVIVHRNYLTVTARPNGEAPTDKESADVAAAPVEQASPDAQVDTDLADGEGETLPDRGDAPDHLVDTVTPGEKVGDYTVGEYLDGPSSIDGWVVGVTESGGPIVRTEDGKDWPLLPDAKIARDENGPEMPAEMAKGPQGAPSAPSDEDHQQAVLDRAVEILDRGEAQSHDEAVTMAEQQIAEEQVNTDAAPAAPAAQPAPAPAAPPAPAPADTADDRVRNRAEELLQRGEAQTYDEALGDAEQRIAEEDAAPPQPVGAPAVAKPERVAPEDITEGDRVMYGAGEMVVTGITDVRGRARQTSGSGRAPDRLVFTGVDDDGNVRLVEMATGGTFKMRRLGRGEQVDAPERPITKTSPEDVEPGDRLMLPNTGDATVVRTLTGEGNTGQSTVIFYTTPGSDRIESMPFQNRHKVDVTGKGEPVNERAAAILDASFARYDRSNDYIDEVVREETAKYDEAPPESTDTPEGGTDAPSAPSPVSAGADDTPDAPRDNSVDLARAAGYQAYLDDAPRAPGANSTVLDLIGDAGVGDQRTRDIMIAFDEGYGQAGDDDLAGRLNPNGLNAGEDDEEELPPGVIGAAPSRGTVTTVTLPDGTTATRTSKAGNYTHVVVSVPATPEARKAAYDSQADAMEAKAAKYDAALAEGRVVKRNRGTSLDPNNFNAYEAEMVGTEERYTNGRGTYREISVRCNEAGESLYYGELPDGVAVIREEKGYPVVRARELVLAMTRDGAEGLRERAALMRAEGEKPDPNGYTVLRWTSSPDLGRKAIAGEFAYEAERYGRTLSVVPVDTTDKPDQPDEAALTAARLKREAVVNAGLDPDRITVTGNIYTSTVAGLRQGDVIYTQGDGSEASPVQVSATRGGNIAPYAKIPREVASVNYNGTITFTDGTSTVGRMSRGSRVAHVPLDKRDVTPDVTPDGGNEQVIPGVVDVADRPDVSGMSDDDLRREVEELDTSNIDEYLNGLAESGAEVPGDNAALTAHRERLAAVATELADREPLPRLFNRSVDGNKMTWATREPSPEGRTGHFDSDGNWEVRDRDGNVVDSGKAGNPGQAQAALNAAMDKIEPRMTRRQGRETPVERFTDAQGTEWVLYADRHATTGGQDVSEMGYEQARSQHVQLNGGEVEDLRGQAPQPGSAGGDNQPSRPATPEGSRPSPNGSLYAQRGDNGDWEVRATDGDLSLGGRASLPGDVPEEQVDAYLAEVEGLAPAWTRADVSGNRDLPGQIMALRDRYRQQFEDQRNAALPDGRADALTNTGADGQTRYGRPVSDLRPGDRVYVADGSLVTQSRMTGFDPVDGGGVTGGNLLYPTGGEPRTVTSVDADKVTFEDGRSAPISSPNQRVLIEPDAPEGGQGGNQPEGNADHPAADIANGAPDPIEFRYVRNPNSSTTSGADQSAFGQDVEPAGRYLNVASGDFTPEGWDTGTVRFEKPLHMDFGGQYGEESNWKNRLSQHYGGLTGQALSDAVRADGYDAIMTNDAYGDSEVVDLTNGGAERLPQPSGQPLTFEALRALDWQETEPGRRWEATLPDGRHGIITHRPEGIGSIEGGYAWSIKDDQREQVMADDSGYDFFPGFDEALRNMASPNPDRGVHPTLRQGGAAPGPDFNPDDWIVRQTALRNLARHYGITYAEAEQRFNDRLVQTGQGNVVTASSMRALMAERDGDTSVPPLPVGPDGEPDLTSLITPEPDLSVDPASLDAEGIAKAIRGIDDNIINYPKGSPERRDRLVYRARLVAVQQERNRQVPPDTEPDTSTVSTSPVSADDLGAGSRVVFDDGTVATITGKNKVDGQWEFTYRDADGGEGTYIADPGTTFAHIDATDETPIAPEPEQNPEPEIGRDAQVSAEGLVPGDRIWLGNSKVEVTDVRPNDADTMTVTVRFPDRRTETLPFGRDAVLDRAEDEFLPDPSPLDKTTPTSRPVLYTYQRRNIVALGLDTDADPMVAEAARRIRMRQPLAAAHSAALAQRLAEMSQADGVKPQRQRMLLRLAAANNAASIEAGGRGVDLPEMPNTGTVSKARPSETTVGDQIAFLGLGGRLMQGRITNLRNMMGGRLTEVTIDLPDGTQHTTMLTRNTDVYVLPDLPEPTPVRPADGAAEYVDVSRLRPGDRVRVPNNHQLFEDEQGTAEATVLRVGTEPSGNTYAVLDVHSVYSEEEDQSLVLTSVPDDPYNSQDVIRVSRSPESADQPRDRDLPALDPHEVNASEVQIGDWLAVKIGTRGATADGIVAQVEIVNGPNGQRIGQRFRLKMVNGDGNWVTVTDAEDYTMTRLMKGDENTILRMEQQKRERDRAMLAHAAAAGISEHLSRYNNDLSFMIATNALHSGGIADEHYDQIVNDNFSTDETISGRNRTSSMDTTRLRAIGRMTSALQVYLSGENEGTAFTGVREAAARLAEQIVNDHHERSRQALLNAQPTEPGESRAVAGANLARRMSVGNADVEYRDLMAIGRGIVNARFARAEADAGRTGGPEGSDLAGVELPEGGDIEARINAYKSMLSGRFGFTEQTVSSFGEFDLDSLERGEVPSLTTAVSRAKDRATDGGPGADTMRQLDVLKSAGADLSALIDREFAAEFPDPEAMVAEAKTAADEAFQAYVEAQRVAGTAMIEAQDRLAQANGFRNWNHMSSARIDADYREDRLAYEQRTGEYLGDLVNRVRHQARESAEVANAQRRREEAQQAYQTLDQHRRDMSSRIAEARAKAARRVLAQVRPMGGKELSYNQAGRKKYEGGTNPLRSGETMQAMRYAETNYPKEWLDTLGQQKPLSVGTTGRGFFERTRWIIRLSADDNRNNESGWVPPRGRVATHELGHAMETVIPGLPQAEEAFLWSRTSEGEVGSRSRTRRKRIDSSTSYVDEFPEPYSGKDYADGTHYELFTTGMESLFAGSPYLDEDFRNWMLGVLALL